MASGPALRSMVMGEARLNAQPKNGIESNSFFATNASGGNRKLSASVSHVEECFDMTMCGAVDGGICSAPITRWRMPQIKRAPNRANQHQPVINLKRASRGIQNASSTRTAYSGVTTSWYSAKRIERRADITREVLLTSEKRGRCKGKIRKDHGVLREVAFAQRLLALARQQQDRLCA